MPQPVFRRFLDWQRPVAEVAAEFFAREVAGDSGKAFDFSGNVVVVPTHEAGRKLLDAMTENAESVGQGIFPPCVLTPAQCLRTLRAGGNRVATDTESRFAMVSVLRELRIEDFSKLFPVTPPARDRQWALGLAETILGLRAVLSESPEFFDCARVAGFAENPEPERWADLARIEEKYRARLAERGLCDKDDARREIAESPALPAMWKKIYFLATPDFSPLLPTALAKIDAGVCETGILIVAPESLKDGFDAWGRVIPDFWAGRELVWENFDAQTKLAATPETLSENIAEAIGASASADGSPVTTLGLIDETLAGAGSRGIEAAGFAAYNPAGNCARDHFLGAWIGIWENFISDANAGTVGALLRLPFFAGRLAPSVSLGTLLGEWDDLRDAHLPDTLDDALFFARKRSGDFSHTFPALEKLVADKRGFESEAEWPAALRALLREIFAETEFDAADTGDNETRRFLEIISEEIETFEALCRQGLDAGTGLLLLCRRLATERLGADAGENTVAMPGWLELFWDDSPHLILAGMNEGYVPETITADAFLPGTFREKLGLATNESRLARDAYYLQKMLAQRAGGHGRTDVFILQTNTQGEPLRPSRLLFLCARDELPARVKRLFSEPAMPTPDPARTVVAKFVPPVLPEKIDALSEKIAVTKFASYLQCPFRFYLKNVLRMEEKDSGKTEPTPAEFGSAIHFALEKFGSDATAKNFSEAGEIQKFVIAQLDLYLKNNYGANLPLPVIVAAESAKNRLSAFAREQARLRREGWEIWRVETRFDELLQRPFRLDAGGAVIVGKIDRIDFRPETNRLRIIDYKTSGSAKKPFDAHLKKLRDGIVWPQAFAHAEIDGEMFFWKNLQLPLYRHLLRAAPGLPAKDIELAYFNLPKAATESALDLWSDFTPELGESALACARGILKSLRGRVFWPPNPNPEFDDFELLLSPSPEDVVDFEQFRRMLRE